MEAPTSSKADTELFNSVFPEDITIFSWNIDGLDTGNIQTRFTAALQIIGR